jgi:hypothetical protein
VKRSEAQQVLGFARVSQSLLDVVWMGWVVHDGWFFPCLRGGVGDHVHHRMVLACSDVEGFGTLPVYGPLKVRGFWFIGSGCHLLVNLLSERRPEAAA